MSKQYRGALDFFLAFAAVGSLLAILLIGLPPIRSSNFSASDFKTLYASSSNFLHGKNAYSIADLAKVFQRNGVVQPDTWYGHAPVYPPVTLALLAPIAFAGMVPAIWCALLSSALLWVLAVAALLRYASEELHLPWYLRVMLAGLCAATPLLAFALTVGNVSVAVAALCILALTVSQRGFVRSAGVMLAVALLLKPHIAIWVIIPMVLLSKSNTRATARRAIEFTLAFSGVVILALAASGTLGLQFRGFLNILNAETSAGSSMNPSSHEVLPVVAQITSFRSIIGFWISNPHSQSVFNALVLLGLVTILVWITFHTTNDHLLTPIVTAWCALGLLATYHRAHDAMVLLIAAPWVLNEIRRAPRYWAGWAIPILFFLASSGFDITTTSKWVGRFSPDSICSFLLLRQSPIAIFLLMAVILHVLANENHNASMGCHSIEINVIAHSNSQTS